MWWSFMLTRAMMFDTPKVEDLKQDEESRKESKEKNSLQ